MNRIRKSDVLAGLIFFVTLFGFIIFVLVVSAEPSAWSLAVTR